MANIDRDFVRVGLVLLVLGMLLGLYMGAAADNTYLDVHVALLLVGFVLLSLYGAIYRLWPELKAGALTKLQFWLATTGSVLITLGAVLMINQMGVAVVATGSGIAILGAVLMCWKFWTGTNDAR